MFSFSKNRLESFSDGVIAIIITVMVLNIPLPNTFGWTEILLLLRSILVFFVSFFIVGSHWNNHHLLLGNIQEVSGKVVWRNLLFLFFVALIPIFTNWVMQNPNEVVPAIGYDLVFLLVNLSYQFVWDAVIHQNGNEKMHGTIDRLRKERKYFWLVRWVIMLAVVAAIITFSVFYPRLSLVFFIGFPVISSLFNLIVERNRDFRIPTRE